MSRGVMEVRYLQLVYPVASPWKGEGDADASPSSILWDSYISSPPSTLSTWPVM
jgi:hypothetical protein